LPIQNPHLPHSTSPIPASFTTTPPGHSNDLYFTKHSPDKHPLKTSLR
jgi:hypothetical protein